MERIPFETASQEIENWLNSKKIPQKRQQKQAVSVEALTDLIQEGTLIVNEDFTLTLKLNFPENIKMNELVFKHRISEFELAPNRKLVNSNDPQSGLVATAATLTNQLPTLIQKLDSIDLENVNHIAVFF